MSYLVVIEECDTAAASGVLSPDRLTRLQGVIELLNIPEVRLRLSNPSKFLLVPHNLILTYSLYY
jgi:hypothetical protein